MASTSNVPQVRHVVGTARNLCRHPARVALAAQVQVGSTLVR
jgi:hypothetical protein